MLLVRMMVTASLVTSLFLPLPVNPLWHEGVAPLSPHAALFPDFSERMEVARDAVISITTVQETDTVDDSLKGLLDPTSQPQKGIGSGFLINPEGYLITNAHVIERATRIGVTLRRNGRAREYRARVVGADVPTDIALLKIDSERTDFPSLPLGDSDHLRIAEWIAIIGNPFGLSQTVTLGIVSYKGRSDIAPSGRDGYYDFIQTDASINPGNSGGPVLNQAGEVVGIANAVNAVGQGIGFAIPINMAKQVLPPLLRKGSVERSWLGVAVEDVSPEMAQERNLGGDRENGALISAVLAHAPGAEAGLQIGDVVLRIDDRSIENAQQLRWLAATMGSGREVSLKVLRDGNERELCAKLRTMPDDDDPFEAPQLTELGLEVGPIDVPNARRAGLALPLGARVRGVRGSSIAAHAGLRTDDLILKVNEIEIRSPTTLARVFLKPSPGSPEHLVVRREGETLFLSFRSP